MMRALLSRAVNPQIGLLDALRGWNSIASDLREPPRRRRRYQYDGLKEFLT